MAVVGNCSRCIVDNRHDACSVDGRCDLCVDANHGNRRSDFVVVVQSVVDSTIDCCCMLLVVSSMVVDTIVSGMPDSTYNIEAIDALMSRRCAWQ